MLIHSVHSNIMHKNKKLGLTNNQEQISVNVTGPAKINHLVA